MLIRNFLFACFSLLVIVGVPSCAGWFQGACEAAMPSVTKTQGYIVDAGQAVDQAEAVFVALPLTDAQKGDARLAVLNARKALRAAQLVVNSVGGACQQPDALSALSEFVKVWPLIETLLAQDMQGGASGTASAVAPPSIVVLSRARR